MKMELGKPKENFHKQDLIVVPPMLPKILKAYAKAAIKTQPYDLLSWSASYFKAMAEGKKPPIKEYIEYPIVRTTGGLTSGFLKIILDQFSNETDISKDLLKSTWVGISLNENELKQIMCTAGIYNQEFFPLYKFISVAAGFLCKNLKETMILLCKIFTKEPEGGSAAINSDLFIDLYVFLASIDASKTIKYVDGLTQEKPPINAKQSDPNDKNNNNSSTLLRVYSEDGIRVDDNGYVPSPDHSTGSKISVKEMVEVMEKLQKSQEEKVKNMEETLQSIESLAEENRNIKLMRKDSSISEKFIKSEKASIEKTKSDSTESKIDPNAKGVVNPFIKGIFDNVAEKIGVINTWQKEVQEKQSEVIIVPAIPGIGPAVDDEIAEEFLKYVRECSSEQNSMFMPRDIRFAICPPLEKN